MPWMMKDVDSHMKGLTDAQKKQWVEIANSALDACTKKGGSNCDVAAIRQANGVLSRQKKTESYHEAQQLVVEVGRMISAANASKLSDAFKAMQTAMATIEAMMTDHTESVNLSSSSLNPMFVEAMVPGWLGWSLNEASKVLAQDESFDSRRMAVQTALRRRALAEYAQSKLQDMASNMSDGMDYYDCGPMPWIRDLYDDYVVYCLGSELYESSYKMDGDQVTLDDPVPVKVSYVPASESKEVVCSGDLVKFEEKAVTNDGTVKIKLISAGWGSSGYYSKEVLQRDGPNVFKKGTHMYMNHPTEEEDKNRPERDLRDLVGIQTSEAQWMDNGPTGPGLYADATVFDHYRNFINEAAPYIGVSIRAGGKASEGQAEGRYGTIVEALVDGYSVDYVTIPGRGGEVLPLLEAARASFSDKTEIREANASDYAYVPDPKTPSTWKLDISDKAHVSAAIAALGKGFRGNKVDIPSNALAGVKAKVRAAWRKFNPDVAASEMPDAIKESATVDENEAKQLRESIGLLTETNKTLQETLTSTQTELARLRERAILSDAKGVIARVLAGITMPDITRARLAETCARTIPLKDGELDVAALEEAVKKTAESELAYLQSVAPAATTVVGLGVTSTLNDDDADKMLESAFTGLLGASKAAIAVKGR